MDVDLQVFELLASRMCHDLVSPVGAIKSGLELFTEFGEDPDGETMALINGSAEQASQKLQFFRVAYGQAGSQREDVKLALDAASSEIYENGRYTLAGEGKALDADGMVALYLSTPLTRWTYLVAKTIAVAGTMTIVVVIKTIKIIIIIIIV